MSKGRNVRGRLLVLAAPSGAGKTTLVRALLERVPNLRFSVSYTTRPPRPGARDGTSLGADGRSTTYRPGRRLTAVAAQSEERGSHPHKINCLDTSTSRSQVLARWAFRRAPAWREVMDVRSDMLQSQLSLHPQGLQSRFPSLERRAPLHHIEQWWLPKGHVHPVAERRGYPSVLWSLFRK